MTRRIVLLVAALAVAVPSLGYASAKTFTPPWKLGGNNQGADSNNQFMLDASTGSMTLIRLGASPGGFGCAAYGPFANFTYDYAGTGVVNTVVVHYTDALIDPYTWFNAGIIQNGVSIARLEPRGPFAGSGDLTLNLIPQGQPGNNTFPYQNSITSPVSGPFTIEFGISVPGACPNVDGGSATFSSVTVNEA